MSRTEETDIILTRDAELDLLYLPDPPQPSSVSARPDLDVLVARQQPLHVRPREPLPDLRDQRVEAAVVRRFERRAAAEHDRLVLVNPRARHVEVFDRSRRVDATGSCCCMRTSARASCRFDQRRF